MASVPGKFLNSENIAKKVFDNTTDAIRVTGTIGGATEVIIDAASGDNIAIKNSDGSDITPSNPLPVSVQTINIGEVEIKNDAGNPVPVSASDLDIRDLDFATDKVDTSGSTVFLDATTLAALESVSTNNGALETTQQQVLAELQNANSSLDAIELDADAIRVATQSIDTNIDVALSTRASEITQLSNNTELQNINTELDTQTALLQSIDQSTNDIETRIETFDTNIGATGVNTLRTSSNITDESGNAFSDSNYLPVGQTTHDNLNVNANIQVNNLDVSSSNRVPIDTGDTGGVMVVDEISPLPAGVSYFSPWFDTLGYGDIVVSVFSDVAGGYFEIDWSRDLAGTNPRPDGDQYFISANVLKGNIYGPKHRYFRIRFVNGPSAMSVFELQVTLKKIHTKPSSHKINEEINDNADSELVKSVGTGKNPNNLYRNVRVQGGHAANSSNTPLPASGIFRGTWFNWQEDYIAILVDTSSDVNGTLFVDLSQEDNPIDGNDVSIEDSIPFLYVKTETPILKIKLPLQSKWIRIRYVNGPAAQTVFFLDTAFSISDPGLTQGPLLRLPSHKNIAGLVRAVLTVPNGPDADYKEYPMSTLGNPKSSIAEIHDDISIEPLDTPVMSQLIVGTTATRIDNDAPTNRRVITITNEGPGRAAVGFLNTLTFNSQSHRLPVNRALEFMLPASVNVFALAETTSGTQTTLQRSPGGTSSTGSPTNPGNVTSNNAVYANFTAQGQTITGTTYTAGTTNSLVAVRLGIDGNKQSGQVETVSVGQVVSGATAGAGSVVSASLAGGSNQLYIAVVTRNDSSGTVTGVSGGGINFTPTSQVNISNGNRRIDVWFAYGTFTSGSVTANLSAATNAHIAVYRIVNADSTTPIQTISSTTGSGTAITGPGVAGTNKGLAILAISHGDGTGNPGVGYTENVDLTNGAGSNTDGIITANKPLVSTGTETGTYTLANSSSWAAIGLTIKPREAIDPVITLSYTLSGIPGTTTGQVTLSSSSDVSSTVDVTADRAWAVADIPNVNVIATASTLSAAQANIDWIYLELVDTTGNTARLSIYQGGRTVT